MTLPVHNRYDILPVHNRYNPPSTHSLEAGGSQKHLHPLKRMTNYIKHVGIGT